MSLECVWSTQKALYGILTADSALTSLVNGVYDHVPEAAVFPYVVFAHGEAENISSLAKEQWVVSSTIAVYAQEQGTKNLLAIATTIQDVLHGASLTVSGFSCLPVNVKKVIYSKQIDGKTYKASLELEIVLQAP